MSQSPQWMITARPILHYHWWSLPVVTVLYLLSSFLEGIGLTLFIPLLQNLSDPGPVTVGGLEGLLRNAFSEKFRPASGSRSIRN